MPTPVLMRHFLLRIFLVGHSRFVVFVAFLFSAWNTRRYSSAGGTDGSGRVSCGLTATCEREEVKLKCPFLFEKQFLLTGYILKITLDSNNANLLFLFATEFLVLFTLFIVCMPHFQ